MRNGEGLRRKDLIRWKREIREGIINGAKASLEGEICLEDDASTCEIIRGGGGAFLPFIGSWNWKLFM